MIPMAFTNYSVKGDHLVLFDWTGFASFGQVLGLGGKPVSYTHLDVYKRQHI